ncbi:hypothetical protein OPV22_002376 [Ensete ventricosum]|uniref:Uncharacterized protein n=1 Tax=Ensete ventricosum TaxID=4639 RepID=A0AAV8RXQ7_ENSVE|nr:hypothetical protein OPV22_002376 [Ensete ventricosum]
MKGNGSPRQATCWAGTTEPPVELSFSYVSMGGRTTRAPTYLDSLTLLSRRAVLLATPSILHTGIENEIRFTLCLSYHMVGWKDKKGWTVLPCYFVSSAPNLLPFLPLVAELDLWKWVVCYRLPGKPVH